MARLSTIARPVAPVVAAIAGTVVVRRRLLRWGATVEEVALGLPGDGLLERADLVATRAIGIDAPAEGVWPWLAQMGQGRGGLYSYDRLENLVGCDLHSADRIVAEWQQIEVGDPFRLHPQVALEVAVVDPPRALVVVADDRAAPYTFSWAFVVIDGDLGRSRLVVRERYRYRAAWARLLVEPLAAVSWLMTQRMLRGVRDRAEAPQPPPAVWGRTVSTT